MKISIFNDLSFIFGVDYSQKKDCLGVFEISDEDNKKLNKGCKIEVKKGKLNIIETEEYLRNMKEERLLKMTLEEILKSKETFSDLGIKGYELGNLLNNKFFDGNIYKELQIHRAYIEKLAKVVFQKEDLNEKDLIELKKINLLNKKVKVILQKF